MVRLYVLHRIHTGLNLPNNGRFTLTATRKSEFRAADRPHIR
jgi:hypothetical protein